MANSNCQWYEGCSEPFYTSTPIPLCEAHAAELRMSDQQKLIALLEEIRSDLKLLLARGQSGYFVAVDSHHNPR